MSKQDDIEFLNSRLQCLQRDYGTLQELLPCDLLPTSDDPPQTSEEDERCAQLADKYGLNGSLFRNLFPLYPDRNGVDFELLIKRYRKQIEMVPRIIAAIETSRHDPTE